MYGFKKLNKEKVVEICKLGHEGIKSSEVAKKYGVSIGTINDILVGRVCKTHTEGIRPTNRNKIKYKTLSDCVVEKIRDTSNPVRVLERELGISRSVIKRCRAKFLNVTAPPQTTVYDRMTEEQKSIVHDLTISQTQAAKIIGTSRSVIKYGREKFFNTKTHTRPIMYDRMIDKEKSIIHDLTISIYKAAVMLGVSADTVQRGREKFIRLQ